MIVSVFLTGLVLGSFINVLVRRLPAGESVIYPGSRCPLCKAPIKWRSNIPVLSFLLQRGRCRECGGKISLMYPLVELITAFLFCLIFLQSDSTILAIKNCSFAFLMLAAAFTDIHTAMGESFESGVIPDVYTVGGVLCGYIWALFTPPGVVEALAGSGAGFFIIMIPALLYRAIRKTEGIGEGDALLLAAAGSFLGLRAVAFVLLFSSLIGLVTGAIVLAKTKNIHYKIPFAPAIATASMLWIFMGEWFYGAVYRF